jgi:hypothetical protein
MRSSPGDLLSLHLMFIGWSTKRYTSGCKYRESSSIGPAAPSHSYSGYSQTMTIVKEANGGDCFHMSSMCYRIVPRTTVTKKG